MFSLKRGTKKGKEKGRSVTESYDAFCYRLVGRRIEEGKDRRKLADRLRRASFSLTPGMYLSRLYVTAAIVFAVSLTLFFIVFALLLRSDMWYLFVAALTTVSTGASLAFFPMVMSSRITNRGGKIDQELSFSLSELSILASTGLSPVDIFRKMAKRNEKETITAEYKKAVYKLDIEGKDLITALSETARESSSDTFRETLWDLSNMIHQGGDLDHYLRSKADDVMKAKRNVQKQFVDKLGTYSDIYITVVLVGVLMLCIGAFLIDAMNSSVMGMGGSEILMILTYLFLPLAIFFIGFIVYNAYTKVNG